MITPRQLKALFKDGKNICEILRSEKGVAKNTTEIIEISYDIQAGTYIEAMENPSVAEFKAQYALEIAKTIRSLCKPSSILEAGVGEATTLSGVLKHLENDIRSFGFDISWSRVACAKRWLKSQGILNCFLCTGNLLNIPFADNSIDVVFTSHSIEPNGGNEGPILEELYRVAKNFLVLLEPSYELANENARRRMELHGYCKNLKGFCEDKKWDVLEHKLFPLTANPLNPTALTIIRKQVSCSSPSYILACPKLKTPLVEIDNILFSAESCMAYPIIGGIPCLRIENGIFASKLEDLKS
jgi:ubiquinone/menaquinone biosynthesis C-methylase UbiE